MKKKYSKPRLQKHDQLKRVTFSQEPNPANVDDPNEPNPVTGERKPRGGLF